MAPQRSVSNKENKNEHVQTSNFEFEIIDQYSISSPFPFFILITILIQATQADQSTWLLYAGWVVMRTKMSMVIIMGMRSKTDLLAYGLPATSVSLFASFYILILSLASLSGNFLMILLYIR